MSDLVIETTRRCNMECAHCLRGDPEPLDFDPDTLTRYLAAAPDPLDYINTITFSGGEPSLVPHIIQKCLEICRDQNVTVDNFFISTNGKKPPQTQALAFLGVCLEWWAYCIDNEAGGIRISTDEHHTNEGQDPRWIETLKQLRFTFTEGVMFRPGEWFKQGRASNWGTRDVTIDPEDDPPHYLNALGEVILGCDWSYKNQKEHECQLTLKA